MIGLIVILTLVLFLPFSIKIVERNLEFFLLLMGISATLVGHVLTQSLLIIALKDSVYITLAVLFAGLIFRWFQRPIEKSISRMSHSMPLPLFLGLVVIILGIVSSVITAIIAAIVLVTITSVLKLDRVAEVRFVILACFSIGMGAALTPIGEPLSTIATSKLNEHFFYLLQLIGPTVIPSLVLFGVLTTILVTPIKSGQSFPVNLERESYTNIIVRSVKIYAFVTALTLLGAGFEPFIEKYLLGVSPLTLYWLNMISAVLDNATLAAAEMSPLMDNHTIKAILLGLLISGGMLIPGNIPNIIAAGKLNISSLEWAKFGVPVGLVVMSIYFIVLRLLG